MRHDTGTNQHGDHPHDEDHDKGLALDLPTIMNRRRALSLLGLGVGVAGLAGCATSTDGATASTTSAASSAGEMPGAGGPGGGPGGAGGGPGGAPPADGGSTVEVADGEIPEETAGPYPGDGSNGVNVLTESGIVRSDITASFGSATGVAQGVPLTVTLKVIDLSADAQPLSGAAVYLWHCDRDGQYSLYSQAVADENYLRGVQETASDGTVTFTTIFPAAYSGRWPHIHFEIYPSLAEATSASNKMRTSQLALPEDVCDAVYATTGYESSVNNMAQTSLDSDNVFSDGYSLQVPKVTGSVSAGYAATLNVPV